MHQQQQQHHQQQFPHQLQKQRSHEDATTMHCHSNAAYSEANIATSSQCHQSHPPHQHTSPPHQSQHHVHDYESASPLRSRSRSGSRQAINSNGHGHGHVHHHHHRQRRRRQQSHSHHNPMGIGNCLRCNSAGGVGGSGSLPGAHSHRGVYGHSSGTGGHHSGNCARRHRSVTDVSNISINAGCHDALCADREVQEILVRKSCCSSSRTELAQYFAEDLYGSSRRPSSCCTSSDYCYQTDSTSLYGSRSSLSRNNSIKSASAAMRKHQRMQKRQSSYTTTSLRALNASQPNSQLGSLTSIFDRAKQIADEGKCTPSDKTGTLERQTSKDALSNDLPEYACSPSPIRWSFLADGKSPTEFEVIDCATHDEKFDTWKFSENRSKLKSTISTACMKKLPQTTNNTSWKSTYEDDNNDDERPSTSAAAAAAARKRRNSAFRCEFEESTTVLFHQEGEAFNNCCNNYIQCNTYLDQDLQITSEDIHQYLSKGNLQTGDVLNNSKTYPFQPSNALEFQYKNNFAANNNNNNYNTNTTNTASSDAGEAFQRYEYGFRRNSSKETNLNQNSIIGTVGEVGSSNEACAASSSSSTPLSPTNINLSSSTNNINIVFNACLESNANEVKFINTARDTRENVVSTEAEHTGYLQYTYPTYDYANMSSNMSTSFDKQLGINELPKDFESSARGSAGCGDASTTSEHSSSLQSPVQTGVSFESFDAVSEQHLLSHRSSYQYSPTSRTPISPGSPASINPAGDTYMHLHHTLYDFDSQHLQEQQQQQQQQQQQHHQLQHQQPQHIHSTSRHGNAFKRVRKRARKYTEFLRKK